MSTLKRRGRIGVCEWASPKHSIDAATPFINMRMGRSGRKS
jgi:hypothetical protein